MIVATVTAGDIAAGVRGNRNFCPVALALERATGERWHVEPTQCTRVIGPPGARVALPVHVATFVTLFDAGYPVTPCEFWIDDWE